MRVLSCLGLLMISLLLQAAAHPSASGDIDASRLQQYENSVFENATLSLGSMVFHGPAPAVQARELSQPEKYILFGVRTSQMPDRGPMQAWSQLIYSFADKYYKKHGKFPGQLSAEIVSAEVSLPGASPELRAALIESYRSPITGNWPRLDSERFAPGQVYIRLMTQAEINHVASKSPFYRGLFSKKQCFNPDTGKIGTIHFVSPPVYFRIYGENKPIIEMIKYQFDFD